MGKFQCPCCPWRGKFNGPQPFSGDAAFVHNPVPIEPLTEAERIDLNHRAVTRLKFLHEMTLHARMLDRGASHFV